MKTKFLLIATAALCLAACNKQEIIDGPDDHGKEGDYMIEIAELDQPTKSSPSTVELNLADLVSPSSKNITAQLKKRSGSGWANVDNGVTYSWSATSEDNQKFSGSGTVNQSCNVSAKKAGTGNITVSAAISGTTVATQPVPVKVSDDRALSWTNATTSLTAGEVKTAVLNSNFSGTASISSNNSSFLVGTSENSLNTTTSVTFGTKKSHTIYYKYTGSSQTTVKMYANSADNICSSEVSISTEKKTYKIAAEGEEEIVPDAYFHPNYPAGTYRVYLSADNSIKIYEEAHEFDLQYETTQCHSSCCYKFGYEDDNGVFHEFANYSIYKDSSLKAPVNLNSLAGLALGGSTWTDGELNWVGSTNKTCTVYISVKDSGYEGVYKGLCYKYNYL